MHTIRSFHRRLPWMPRWRSQSLTLAIIVCATMLVPGQAMGQVTFEWGTVRRDTLYLTVEHCLGIQPRVGGHSTVIDTLFWDTVPTRLRVVPNSQSPTSLAAAQQCSQKFTVAQLLSPESLDINEAINAFRLLYQANRLADAFAFVDGWIAKLPATSDTMRNIQRVRLAQFVLETHPTRFDVIQRLADSLNLRTFWWDRVRLYGLMMERAMQLQDTAALERVLPWLLETPKLLGDSIMQTAQWQDGVSGVGRYVMAAKQFSQRELLLARLRESSTRYFEMIDLLRKEAGFPGIDDRKLAKPILAEFWFPQKPAADRPTRGKVAIVKSLSGNLCNPCAGMYSMLKRLAKKFPEVEFTLLARTFGSYGWEVGTLSLADETRMIDSMHRTVHGFPGIVSVHEGKFWRLPDPDRRVIEEPGPNQDQYPTLGPFTVTLLIDRAGRIIDGSRVALDPEEAFELLIQAVLSQQSP